MIGERSRDAVLAVLVAAGCLAICLPVHPGLADLPQHAGQIAVLRDLLLDRSRWSGMLQIHWFTPYLAAYLLGSVLSMVMPVAVALKVLLCGAFVGYVIACRAVRRALGGDARLDWLFVPGFFGFAYQWGFLTFLCAAPVALGFTVLAYRYSAGPTLRQGVALAGVGTLLFFCHGLAFVFACAIGVAFLLARCRARPRLIVGLVPYAALGLLLVAYLAASQGVDDLSSQGSTFNGGYFALRRYVGPILFPLTADTRLTLAPLLVLLLGVPFLIGSRLNTRASYAWIPLAVLVAVWVCVPSHAMKTWYLYERFALFALPFYTYLFRPAAHERRPAWMSVSGTTIAALVCLGFMGLQVSHAAAFSVECRAFDAVIAALEPGQRLLYTAGNGDSSALVSTVAYRHFPAWYQAEKSGWVEFNFAVFRPQVVRYAPGYALPDALRREVEIPGFDWRALGNRDFRYLLVRRRGGLPASILAAAPCSVRPVAAQGDWTAYDIEGCTGSVTAGGAGSAGKPSG